MDAIRTIMTLTAAFMAISCSGLRKAAGSEEKVSVDCAAEIDYSGAGTADIDITAEVPERFRNPNTGIMLVKGFRFFHVLWKVLCTILSTAEMTYMNRTSQTAYP